MKKGKLESRGKRDPWPFTENCVSDLLRDLEKSTSNSKPAFTCPWSKYKVIVTSCFQGPWVWAGSSQVSHVHVGWAWLSLSGTKGTRSITEPPPWPAPHRRHRPQKVRGGIVPATDTPSLQLHTEQGLCQRPENSLNSQRLHVRK